MKRSESMLVYAVTAVLVVIVLVAVVFSGEPEATPETDRTANGGDTTIDIGTMLDDLDADDPAAGNGGEAADPAGEEDPAGSDGAAAEEPEAEPAPSIERLLGKFEVEQFGEQKYRIITVQLGDSFSQLVERWTGSLRRMSEVKAMNEHLDFDSLRIGQQVVLPWVDNAVLVASAMERRPLRVDGGSVPLRTRGAGEPAAVPASTEERGATREAASTAGREYTVQPGEALWQIAAREVGRGGATAYVDRIVAANPWISDPSKVPAGKTILLPSR